MKRLHSANMIKKIVAGLFCSSLCGVVAFAGDVATMQKDQNGVSWAPKPGVVAVTLTVSGPGEFYTQKECDTTDVSITEFGQDGLYHYELVSSPQIKRRAGTLRHSAPMDENGRTVIRTRQSVGLGMKESGYFRIVDGMPMIDTAQEEE